MLPPTCNPRTIALPISEAGFRLQVQNKSILKDTPIQNLGPLLNDMTISSTEGVSSELEYRLNHGTLPLNHSPADGTIHASTV